MLMGILGMLDQFKLQFLPDKRGLCTQLGHAIDHIDHQVEPVESSLSTTMSKGVVVVPTSL